MSAEFLSKILPPLHDSQCYFAIGISSTYRNQKYFQTIEGIVNHCSRMAAGKVDAYMALFSFTSKDGGRTQDNAAEARSIWADLDVGDGDKYPTQAAAIQSLVSFVQATGLRPSIIVSSGRGVHVYWAFDTTVSKADWLQLSEMFQRLCIQEGLKADSACASDPARVMRMPGTINTKNGEMARILKDTGVIWSPLDFASTLLNLVKDKSSVPTATRKTSATKVSHAQHQAMVEAGMIPDGPQIPTAASIVQNCRQIATMGGGSYQQWYYSMGVLKLCKDGREWAHRLSKNDPRYNFQDTENRFAQALPDGPTLCETFERVNPGMCLNCRYRGSIKTPLQLHRITVTVPEPIPQIPIPPASKPVSPLNLSGVPEYPRIALQHPNWAVDHRGILYRHMEVDATGTPQIKEDLLSQAQLYYKYSVEDWDNDRPESAHVFEVVYPGGRTRNVRFSISEDGNSQSIVKWFYNANMYATNGVFKGAQLMAFMNAYLQNVVHQNGRTLTTVNKFGWDDYTDPVSGEKTKGFVTGSGIITASGLRRVHFGKMLTPYADQYKPKGDLKTWRYIPGMYKTLGQHLGQLAICMSFAAPLMKYALGEANSAVLSIWSHLSGQGKTQMLRAAASVWGNPYEQFIDREASTVARTRKLTLLNNMPAFMDEMTTTDEGTMHGLAYTLVGGKEKDKLKSSGDAFVQTGTWSTVTFVTANRSFKEAIARRAGDSNATLLRIMEYECNFQAYEDQPTIREYINQCIELGKHHYGLAGPEFIYRALQHPERIAVLSEEIRHWIDRAGFSPNERFISNALALAIIAGRWAVEFGLLDYDMNELENWVLGRFVTENREKTIDLSLDAMDIFNEYITSRQPHALTTRGARRYAGEIDSGSADIPDSFILKMPNREIYMRINQREQEMLILKGDFSAWCRERRASSSSILRALARRGVTIKEGIRSLSGGISWLPSIRGRCIILDYNSLDSLGIQAMLQEEFWEENQAEVAQHTGASRACEDPPSPSPAGVIGMDDPEPVGNMDDGVVYDAYGNQLV